MRRLMLAFAMLLIAGSASAHIPDTCQPAMMRAALAKEMADETLKKPLGAMKSIMRAAARGGDVLEAVGSGLKDLQEDTVMRLQHAEALEELFLCIKGGE